MTVKLLAGTGGQEQVIPLSQLLTLEQAGFEQWFYPVRDIDKKHVEHLAACHPSELPAIDTVQVHLSDGNVYHAVVDGNHRWEAAIARKETTIKGKAGTYKNENAVIDAAFQANLKHGMAASHATRTDYAIWLYYTDESEKPNLSAIARKAGLNQSTVSRAIKKIEQEDQEQGTSEEQEAPAEVDNTKKLVSALHHFYSQERTLRGMFGDGSQLVDVNHRAKKIYKYLAALPKGKQNETATELISLYETLQAFVKMYQGNLTKTGTR